IIFRGWPEFGRAPASSQSCGRSATWSGFGSGLRGSGGRRRRARPLPKTRDGLIEPIVESSVGAPGERLRGAPVVEGRVPNFARTTLDETDRSLESRQLHQRVYDRPYTRLNSCPDVQRPAGRRLHGEPIGVGHIPNENEVAGLLPIAADLGWPAGEQPVAGDGDHARLTGSILVGTIDIRISQGQGGQLKGPAEHPEITFGGELRRAIRRERGGGGAFRRRQQSGPAVDGAARRREDKARAARVDAGAQQRHGRDDVDQRVPCGITYRARDAALRGQDQDRLWSVADDDVGRVGPI